jgi:hypothetical protein
MEQKGVNKMRTKKDAICKLEHDIKEIESKAEGYRCFGFVRCLEYLDIITENEAVNYRYLINGILLKILLKLI